MRRAWVALAAGLLAAVLGSGCGEPEPEVETPLGRARETDRMRREAEERAREQEKARVEASLHPAPPSAAAVKRKLLAEYGAYLTPFQRSALQAARLSSYAEGEALCRKWIEENRRFDAGQGAPPE